MLKKRLRYFCFSLLFLFTACAPKPSLIAPPTMYEEAELSLKEIVENVSDDIDVLKAITQITIEKNDAPYDVVSASILVNKTGAVHMRIYKYGMLVKDFVIKENRLYLLSGKGGDNIKRLGNEFYNSVFWWNDVEDALLFKDGDRYIIRTETRKIQLDSASLLPVRQEIKAYNKNIRLEYDDPAQNDDGYWYQSVINIFVGEFKFAVKLKKVLKNPELGEYDFQVPAGS